MHLLETNTVLMRMTLKETFVTATRILKEAMGSQEERPDQLSRKHGRDTAGLKKIKKKKLKRNNLTLTFQSA